MFMEPNNELKYILFFNFVIKMDMHVLFSWFNLIFKGKSCFIVIII